MDLYIPALWYSGSLFINKIRLSKVSKEKKPSKVDTFSFATRIIPSVVANVLSSWGDTMSSYIESNKTGLTCIPKDVAHVFANWWWVCASPLQILLETPCPVANVMRTHIPVVLLVP